MTSSSASADQDPPGDLQLPIDAYSLNEDQVDQIQLAITIKMGKCVRAAGFTFNETELATYWKQYTARDIGDVGLYQNLRRYSVTTSQIAKKYGYHMRSTVDEPNQPNYSWKTEEPGFGKISRAELAVMGRGAHPCSAQAYAAVQGTTNEPTDPAGQIADESYSRSLTAAPVAAAFSAWSRCMNSRGYPYANPTRAGSNFDVSTPTVTPQEKAVALADVACKKQTNLIAIWSGWESGYQKQQIDKNAEALQQAKNGHDAQLRRAASIIAGR